MRCLDRIKVGLLVAAIGVAVLSQHIGPAPAPIHWHSNTQADEVGLPTPYVLFG
ncbi:hypothetical protein LA6_003656 [Marinibacterium anthonyi]|nr:hypothetical protein LA6_003656 [Marinibacterium anthonyi]